MRRPRSINTTTFPSIAVQRSFFVKPTLKFTHKDDLNDPFELSRRWETFGCPFNEAIFDKYVLRKFERDFSNIKLVRKKVRQHAEAQGLFLSRAQIRQLSSPERIAAVKAEQLEKFKLMV